MHMGHGSSKIKIWMIVAAAVLCGASFARVPWQVYRQQRANANQAIAEAEHNDSLRVALVKRQAQLKSPIGREKSARERGYLAKGETPYGSPSTP